MNNSYPARRRADSGKAAKSSRAVPTKHATFISPTIRTFVYQRNGLQVLISNWHAAGSRIRCAQAHSCLQVDHHSFGVSHVSRLLSEDVALSLESYTSVAVDAHRLELNSIRHPLMMKARRVDRLLDIHAEVDHVHDHLQNCVDDCRAAGAPNREPDVSIFQHYRRSHRRKRALARSYRIVLAL